VKKGGYGKKHVLNIEHNIPLFVESVRKYNEFRSVYPVLDRKSHHQNSGQNQNIRIANESFENVAKFKYLRMTLTNQNDIHDEIKCRLNSGNACYYSVQNLFSSCLISKDIKIKM
jgi:hypothetical protein